MLDELHRQVEAAFGRARAAQPGAYACARGCARCCQGELTLYALEAERMAAAIALLPAKVRRAAAARAKRGEHCAMLDPRTGACIVYEARPLVCRGFGLATRFVGAITWCPLNFAREAPSIAHVLDLDALNRRLVRAAQKVRSGRALVRIADVARWPISAGDRRPSPLPLPAPARASRRDRPPRVRRRRRARRPR